MPSRPRRLLRWLDRERDPGGAAPRTAPARANGRATGPGESGTAMRLDFVTQQCRHRVHQAAFHAGRRGNKLTSARKTSTIAPRKGQGYRLERLARMALGKMRCPAGLQDRRLAQQFLQKFPPRLPCPRCLERHIEPAVGRPQPRDRHTARFQQRHPRTVRTQSCPAGTAQSQDHRPCPHELRSRR